MDFQKLENLFHRARAQPEPSKAANTYFEKGELNAAELTTLLAMLSEDSAADTAFADLEKARDYIYTAALSGPQQPLPELAIGSLWNGDYRILEQIGAGGFARVYLARQESLGRLVAIKVSHASAQEAEKIARLEHDHIVRVYAHAHVDDAYGIVMPYISGGTFKDWLYAKEELGPSYFRPDEVLAHLGAIVEAMAYAHEQQILHLDLKPENILIGQSGQCFLTDFNVSSADGEISQVGLTPDYTAPERMSDPLNYDPVPAADVWSLGKIIDLIADTTERIEKSGQTSLSHQLRLVALRCTAQQPDNRPNIAQIKDMLATIGAIRRTEVTHSELAKEPALTWLQAQPILFFYMSMIWPQMIATLFNISFNGQVILDNISEQQNQAFFDLIWVYNLVAYPLGVLLMLPVAKTFQRIAKGINASSGRSADSTAPQDAIKSLRSAIWRTIAATAICWLPGIIFFSAGIAQLSEPLPDGMTGKFVVSFGLAWLIGVVYCLIQLEYYTACFGIPKCLQPQTYESGLGLMRAISRRTKIWFTAAGFLPLIVVATLIHNRFDLETGFHRWILIGLIGTGIVGYQMAYYCNDRIRRVLG